MEINKLDQYIHALRTAISRGQNVSSNSKALAHVQRIQAIQTLRLQDQQVLIDMFTENAIVRGDTPQTIVPFETLANDLYVTQGPKVDGHYKQNQRLVSLLGKNIHTASGITALLKCLGTPTSDREKLEKRVRGREYLREHKDLAKQLAEHHQTLARLEHDVLAFSRQADINAVQAHAPSFSHSSFGAVLKTAQEIKAKMQKDGGRSTAQLLEQLNESAGFLFGADLAMQITNLQFMVMGGTMAWSCGAQAVTALGTVGDAAGGMFSGWSMAGAAQVAAPPLVYMLTQKICNKLVMRSIAAQFKADTVNLCKAYQNHDYTGEQLRITLDNPSDTKVLIEVLKNNADLTCYAGNAEKSIVIIGYTKSARRELMQHHIAHRYKTSISVANSVVSLVVATCLTAGMSATALLSLSWGEIVTGLTALPLASIPSMLWSLLKIPLTAGTSLGLLAAAFFAKPRETLYNAPMSIDKQRIALQSLALYLDEVASLHKLVAAHPVLRDALELSEHLDVEKSINDSLLVHLSAIVKNLKNPATTDAEAKILKQQFSKICRDMHKISSLFDAMSSLRPHDPDNFKKVSWARKIVNRFSSWSVSASYSKMLSVRNYFGMAIEAVGELDMCVGLTELLCEEPDSYCLPTFESGTTPHMKATGLWNMLLLESEDIRTKDCELGGAENAQTWVISGDPYSGKSTFLRSVAMAYLMAQTVCIV